MRKAGILLLLSVFIGCSHNKMNQSTAEGLVKRYLLDGVGHIFVNVGRVGTACPYLNDKGKQAELPLDLTPQSNASEVFAEMAGYINVMPDGDGFWKINLTDTGRKAVEAARYKPLSNAALNGCDYQTATLDLATVQLVKVISITPGENTAEINYVWKWITTDLGRGLRQDGKLYSMLSSSQRDNLQGLIKSGVYKLQLPVPPEDFSDTGSVKFRNGPDGWRLEELVRNPQ
jgi:hypothetical protein